MMNPSYKLPDTPDFFQTTSQFPDVFAPRQAESHKGTYGTLAVVGGASGMSGAVVLASTAAIYQGSGKVWAGFNQTALPFAVIPERPEIMLATAEDLLKRKDISAWAVGCGMGLDETASQILNTVLTQNQDASLLLDADALTLLARSHPENCEAAQKRSHLVLTPHPAVPSRMRRRMAARRGGGCHQTFIGRRNWYARRRNRTCRQMVEKSADDREHKSLKKEVV